LTDKSGKPCNGQLAIRVAEQSTSAAALSMQQQARAAAEQLSPPPAVKLSDAASSPSNTLLNQKDLVTSLTSLMAKVEILVKIGDEVAKVCPQLPLHYVR
jgi:hypothetical protein